MISLPYVSFVSALEAGQLIAGEDFFINDYLQGGSYLCPVVRALSTSTYDVNVRMADQNMTIQQGIEAVYYVGGETDKYRWESHGRGVIVLYRDNNGNIFDFDPQSYGNVSNCTNSTIILQYHDTPSTYNLKTCSIYDCDNLYVGRTDTNNYIQISYCSNVYVGDNNTGGINLNGCNDVHIDEANESDFYVDYSTGVTIGSYNEGTMNITRCEATNVGRSNTGYNYISDCSGTTIGDTCGDLNLSYSNGCIVGDNCKAVTAYTTSNLVIDNTQGLNASNCTNVTISAASYVKLTDVTSSSFNNVHNATFDHVDSSKGFDTNGVSLTGTTLENAVVIRSSDEGNTIESILNGDDRQLILDDGLSFLPSSSVTPPPANGKLYGMKDLKWTEVNSDNIIVQGTSQLAGMTLTEALEFLLNN